MTTSQSATTINRRVPERTCVGCHQKKSKWDLVRVVRSSQGGIVIDHNGKEKGRGAYLCKNSECWELASKDHRKNRLGYALRTGLTAEDRTVLSEYSKTICRSLDLEKKVIL